MWNFLFTKVKGFYWNCLCYQGLLFYIKFSVSWKRWENSWIFKIQCILILKRFYIGNVSYHINSWILISASKQSSLLKKCQNCGHLIYVDNGACNKFYIMYFKCSVRILLVYAEAVNKVLMNENENEKNKIKWVMYLCVHKLHYFFGFVNLKINRFALLIFFSFLNI